MHYISLNRDYSNVDGVMERFSDKNLVRRITDEAHEYAMDSHTYEHRVGDVWNEVS